MIDLRYPLKLLFANDPIGNKQKGLHGSFLVDNYQNLIKWRKNSLHN
jgi:hypothetical protein